MRLASKGGIGFREAQAFRWFRLRKRVRQFLRYRPGCPKTVLFIVGCQRSGTSMLHHILRLDPDTVTYDEVSDLSAKTDPLRLRWREQDLVAARLLSRRAPLVVAKPLVEAQELGRWLEAVAPVGRAIWIFRGFRDVVRSNLGYFGMDNGWQDLNPILEGTRGDWRFDHLDHGVVSRIRELVAGGKLGDHDAAALFWYARNSLFFSSGLHQDARIVLCRYEDLVADPTGQIQAVYGFLQRPYPGPSVTRDITTRFMGHGKALNLQPQVEELCRDLEERLLAANRLGEVLNG